MQKDATASAAVGAMGKVRLIPAPLPRQREWNERVMRWAASNG